LHAETLTRELAAEAKRLQHEITERKSALLPLLESIEKAFNLVRRVEQFNMTSQTAKIPAPALHGDVGAVRKLGEVRLELPSEWRQAGRERRPPGTLLSDQEIIERAGFAEG